MVSLSLAGGTDVWAVSSVDGSIRAPAAVPGDIFTDLAQADVIDLKEDAESSLFARVC
jgi:hypothetical protein